MPRDSETKNGQKRYLYNVARVLPYSNGARINYTFSGFHFLDTAKVHLPWGVGFWVQPKMTEHMSPIRDACCDRGTRRTTRLKNVRRTRLLNAFTTGNRLGRTSYLESVQVGGLGALDPFGAPAQPPKNDDRLRYLQACTYQKRQRAAVRVGQDHAAPVPHGRVFELFYCLRRSDNNCIIANQQMSMP